MTPFSGINAKLRPYATALLQVAFQLTPNARIASVKRSRSLQAELYAKWISGRSKYPAAAPGTSKHEKGLAFDLGGLSDSQLGILGRVWESWGGRWGGRFSNPDQIHFEV